MCEDQRVPDQRPSRLARTKNNPLDPDYTAGWFPQSTLSQSVCHNHVLIMSYYPSVSQECDTLNGIHLMRITYKTVGFIVKSFC